MAIEIERKFLLTSEAWRPLVRSSVYLTDGLIAATEGRKARVRIAGDAATITVKSKRDGAVRGEFEYAIPLADARTILETCCGGNVITKWRHFVDHHGLTWEIDEYEGILTGVILAEVELERQDHELVLPHWIGKEVTGDPSFRKINLLLRYAG
jgi:CYTH domain-containing protein